MDRSASNSPDTKTFVGARGGIRHHYQAREDAFVYSAGLEPQTRAEVPWSEITGMHAGFGASVYFTRSNGQEFGVWLPPNEMGEFLDRAVQAWGRKSPERARKVAFDYGEASPAVGWLWFILSLVFPGILSFLLLVDGYHETKCNRLLEADAKLASAKIVSLKKNRRGNPIWRLEYLAETGGEPRKIVGTREVPPTLPVPPAQQGVTVAYSPADLSCWDVSLVPGERRLNYNQRNFTVTMDMGFGWTFAALALVGCGIGIARLRRRNPFREVVRAAGAKL